ncbi:ribonuclease HII, partial [Candidatus Gracilibacteria bacterium]|nr:ribonuclease HII [Candidatus Gracilibacteria bacterium]
FETGIVSNKIIDKINIRLANKLAMEKALKKLFSKINFNCYKEILVDGNDNYEFKNINIKTKFIIKGDDKIDEIKAASIIAKVTRDNLMCKYSFVYSNFSFNLHKGYGTKKHQEELKRFGITSIHRKSFKPVKKILI